MFSRSVLKGTAAHPPLSATWWLLGILKSTLAALIVGIPLLYFVEHHRIQYNRVKDAHCLPYDVFLIDLDQRALGRGDYVWFRSKNMTPFYVDGTRAVKIVAGVPGDRVTVNARGVWINSVHWGDLMHAEQGGKLARMGHTAAEYFRDEIVPPRHLWVMGTSRASFDSRYWGYISDEQVLGRAYPLW